MKAVPVNTQAFFRRAVSVAEHYGFRNIDDFRVHETPRKKSDLDVLVQESGGEQFDRHVLPDVLKHYAATVELRKKQALMFYTPSVVATRGTPVARVSALTLSAVGVHDPLSEVVLVKAALSVMEELGVKRCTVRVNSIGDSDSSARFVREVSLQLRQRVGELPSEYVGMFRQNNSSVIAGLYQAKHPLIYDLPSPLEFLTAPSRKYFKDILELLEYAEIPFELDDRLYGDHAMYSHTLFEIVERSASGDHTKEEVLARGGRYDALTKAYARSAVPAAGIVVAALTQNDGAEVGRPRHRKPNAYLIHIGREARIKSIGVVETLRREKVPIEQCLHFERFSEQIAYAEGRQAKYIVIMGQREALAGVAIVRNAADRSQHTIPIPGLAKYLKEVIV